MKDYPYEHLLQDELYLAGLRVRLKQENLCDILGLKDEDGNPQDSNGAIFCMHHDDDFLPEDVKNKITEHLQSCYTCGELYKEFCDNYEELKKELKGLVKQMKSSPEERKRAEEEFMKRIEELKEQEKEE